MSSLNFITIVGALLTLTSCKGQGNHASPSKNKLVGGGCDGCELMYIGMPENINSVDTCVDWMERGQRLLITGKVYKLDGKTPAPGVIVYYYHTDNTGHYSKRNDKATNQTVHGHIRGWVMTDTKGNYSIYTTRPAPYPDNNAPAHIHIVIKEPKLNEYYIDELVFDDDTLLTGAKRKALENRGGSGVLRVLIKDSLQVAEHNIVLGLNIPNYPQINKSSSQSGLSIGEDQPSFMPVHAFGPDKGTRTCPVCKYGRYHGVVYFVGNNTNWYEIKRWLKFLDNESIARSKYLKVYFVYGNSYSYNEDARQTELEKIGNELDLKEIALTFVPSFADTESEANLNRINPKVENTFIVYRNRTIIDKFIDLKPTVESFKLISETLDKTKGNYFDLPESDRPSKVGYQKNFSLY